MTLVSKEYNVVILNESIVIEIMCKLSFKKWQCHMSFKLIFADVPCRI